MQVLWRRLTSQTWVPPVKPLGQIAAPESDAALAGLVDRLEALGRQHGVAPRGGWFLSPGARPRAREIGDFIEREHGFPGMQHVCDRVGERLGSGARRELECAWHGIGQWRS